MAIHKVLRTYRFIDKDPVCDELRTLVQDEGMYKRLGNLAELASLHQSTIKNLFEGGTRKPQNATVMAIVTCLGYERKFVRTRKLNADEELVFARAWNKKEKDRIASRAKPPSRKKKRAS
jgi:hypothetical protein